MVKCFSICYYKIELMPAKGGQNLRFLQHIFILKKKKKLLPLRSFSNAFKPG
jgi:hypothetical protein